MAPKLVLLPALLLAVCTAVPAAELYRDYTVTVTMDATESSRNGRDWSRTTRRHRYEFSTRLRSDGQLSDYNPKDPAEQQRAMALAGAVQAPPPPEAPAKSMEQIGAEMQQTLAGCAGDEQCLMSLAMTMSSPQMQAQMQAAQASSAARRCAQRTDAAQRQVCLQAAGGAPPAAVQGQDDEALLAEAREARYLHFVGHPSCPARVRVQIDDRTEGAYADVQGMVPYLIEQKADGAGDANLRALLCITHSPVLDTQSGTLWFDAVGVPTVRGAHTRTERGRTERHEDAEMPMPGGVAEWINDTLRRAPAAGTRSAVLPLFRSTQNPGQVEGQARLTATWSFE